jgi:hypothetical protein
VELGKDGVGKIHGLGEISDFEQGLLTACLKDLAANIKKVSQTPSPTIFQGESHWRFAASFCGLWLMSL